MENLEPSLERVWLPGSTLENVQELQEREDEQGLVGKVELFETVGYNFQGLEINWGLYSAHLIHTVPELQEREGEVNDLLERWNCLALYGIILNPITILE